KELLRLINVRKGHFFTVTQGIFETTIIASQELEKQVEKILSRVKIISRFENLSSITIRLSQETVKIPGSYYFILMQLAWSGINVIEVVSTFTEFTVVLKDKEVDLAFTALKAMY
ncbi:aspartate kinase, partial [bacterium]|nr:aspartate kinase [bacterium]